MGPHQTDKRPGTVARLTSVLLPTYNRASFLPTALAAIRDQTHEHWELVIVDDGSTDDTRAVVEAITGSWTHHVTYVAQPNAGPYAARNTALDHARGRYVAFYDSDDVWRPHYLASCVGALDANPDVDWVYGACRTVSYESGTVIAPNTFAVDGVGRPFTRLRAELRGNLRVLTDDATVACAIEHGLFAGLQNSVIRARVFAQQRFRTGYRNEAEDQLFLIRSLLRGHRVGYIDDVLVQYHVHDANSSGSSTAGRTYERQRALLEPLIRGFEDLRREGAFSPAEDRALRRRLAREHFWLLGYATFWQHGRTDAALDAFRRGLQLWPWSLRCWKTYGLACLRTMRDALGHLVQIWLLRGLAGYLRHAPAHPGRWRLLQWAVIHAPLLRTERGARTIRVREGFSMRVDGSSQTGRMLYVSGDYESGTSRVIKQLLRPGDTVLDVGANIGYFSILAARAVGPTGHVWAFEPSSDVRPLLAHNIELNELRNVTIRSEALGAAERVATFYQGPADDTGLASLRPLAHSRTQDVVQRKLDDVLDVAHKVALVKIDVEGAEMEVLRGMSGCLSRDRPHVVLEVTDEYLRVMGSTAEQLRSTLVELGYRMFEIHDGEGLREVVDAADLTTRPGQFNALFSHTGTKDS